MTRQFALRLCDVPAFCFVSQPGVANTSPILAPRRSGRLLLVSGQPIFPTSPTPQVRRTGTPAGRARHISHVRRYDHLSHPTDASHWDILHVPITAGVTLSPSLTLHSVTSSKTRCAGDTPPSHMGARRICLYDAGAARVNLSRNWYGATACGVAPFRARSN